MEHKKEIKPYLEYTNEEGKQLLYERDHIICRTEDGKRYKGRIATICKYRENEETEPENVIYLNTSQNKMSYSGEIIKIADITYICKIPASNMLGYPHLDEKKDRSEFINMIVGLGYDEKAARDMYGDMKKIIAYYNIPLSSILFSVILRSDLDKDGWCQDELTKLHNKLIGTMVQVFQENTDLLRKSIEESVVSQSEEH